MSWFSDRESAPPDYLAPREREVLRLFLDGERHSLHAVMTSTQLPAAEASDVLASLVGRQVIEPSGLAGHWWALRREPGAVVDAMVADTRRTTRAA